MIRSATAPASALLAVLALGFASWLAPAPDDVSPDRPNIILVITDDQPFDTLPSDPPAMPWLQSQLEDGSWLNFSNAVVSTPLCCPSRATILTGRYSRRTGVENNDLGYLLDESDTLAVWLDSAGYRTGLIGKYLNEYPWDRGPYVPPGWDRWLAKTNDSEATTYYGYGLVDEGTVRRVGRGPGDYVTDLLGREAFDFILSTPADVPYFLVYSPPAPHRPWIPAPRHEWALSSPVPSAPDERTVNEVEGRPYWIAAEQPVDGVRLADLQQDRATQRSTLLAVDENIHRLAQLVEARGELDRTVFVLISDNGYAFGQHRWDRKHCHYEECIRVPMVAYSPWRQGGEVRELVSNVDLASTIAELAGVEASQPQDGTSLTALLRGDETTLNRDGVLIDWNGTDLEVPPWSGVRTRDSVYVVQEDGFAELYDLAADPHQLVNVANDPAYWDLRERLAAQLASYLATLTPAG